jgi:hypothetical protein
VLVIPSQIDPLLLPFMTATDAPEEASALARLSTEEIEPIIRRGIGYKLRFHRTPGDQHSQRPEFEEIYHDIQLRLLTRLRALKKDPAEKLIMNLRGYVAMVTRNTCDEYLRDKYPLRRSLKDKVRHYLLSHAEFSLWEDMDHSWVAGFSGWQSLDCSVKDERLAGSELQERLRRELRMVDVARLSLHDLLTTIFDVSHAPLELDALTALVAGFWGIADHRAEPLSADTYDAVERLVSVDDNLATITEQRQLLQRLWAEIYRLPRRQRVALLLNLKNPNGINVITLLPATGIATFEQIAQALEIPFVEFEQLWADLPLDDLRLAAYLGATRQQVINLRKTARERLLKRMSALS